MEDTEKESTVLVAVVLIVDIRLPYAVSTVFVIEFEIDWHEQQKHTKKNCSGNRRIDRRTGEI